jgi:hypothetical protein
MILLFVFLSFFSYAIAQNSLWPRNVFAPYVDVLLYPPTDIVRISNSNRIQHFTLAFIIADKTGKPSWGGSVPLSNNHFATQITQIRAKGGDVLVSFGGAIGSAFLYKLIIGNELGTVITNIQDLTAAYQSVIDQYQLTFVDFDIEGAAVMNTASIDRRNQAIAALKAQNPNLRVSYTLAVLPSGLPASGVYILQSAVKFGAQIDVINIMAMNFGPAGAPNGASGMGGYTISAAKAVFSQAQQAGLSEVSIGITPMIGKNDVAVN